LLWVMRVSDRNPNIKNGNATTHQKIAHFGGKKPSIMCIA